MKYGRRTVCSPSNPSLSPFTCVQAVIQNSQFRPFTVLYFSVRSSRSRALRYGLPSCMSVKKIKKAVTVRRSISKRSHEKIGDCEQSKRSLMSKSFVGMRKVGMLFSKVENSVIINLLNNIDII